MPHTTKLKSALEAAGLSEKQARIYLALLQRGPSGASVIAQEANLKRPITYVILEDLKRQGVIGLVPGEKKKLFIALTPERLAEESARKTDNLKKALPELLTLWNTKIAKPTIRFFEGREGMLNVYRDIASRTSTKEILAFFSATALFPDFEEAFSLLMTLFKNHSIKGREIIHGEVPSFYLNAVKRLPNYRVRRAARQYPFFTDNILYDDCIAMFSFKKKYVLVMEDEDVARSFRSLYELAWEAAGQL